MDTNYVIAINEIRSRVIFISISGDVSESVLPTTLSR